MDTSSALESPVAADATRTDPRPSRELLTGKAGFFRTGAFSEVNSNLLTAMQARLPSCRFVDVNVGRLVSRRALANLISAVREYAFDLVLGRKGYRNREILIRNQHYFREVRTAVRHVTAAEGFDFTLQTQSLWDAGTPGVPHFVYTDHAHLANLYYKHYDRRKLSSESWINLEREIYETAALVFVTSHFARNSLIADYDCSPEKVKCVYSGINHELDEDSAHHLPDSKNILFVGKDWERKGGPELVEAFEEVLKAHPDATLTIVGCRPSLSIPNCTVVGFVPPAEIHAYFRAAGVFCLPSAIEPSAVALVEASAWGLPVVTTAIGGTPDRVLHGDTGLLVNPNDPKALAASLIHLLDSPERSRAMGEAGRTHVSKHFRWVEVAAKMAEDIHRELNPGGYRP